METTKHPIQSNLTIHHIKAAPGKGKTHYICTTIKEQFEQYKFVVALRTKLCADTFESDLLAHLSPDQQNIVITIYSEEDKPAVTQRLDIALADPACKVIIICQKALDSYTKWGGCLMPMVLYIDELFDAIFLKQQILKPVPAVILGIDTDNIQQMPIEQLRGAAERAYQDDKGGQCWSSGFLELLQNLKNACCVSLKKHKEGVKVVALRESNIFENLKIFSRVYLASMILKDTLPELIGEAKGIKYINCNWPQQGAKFNSDDMVTLIPLSITNASSTRLNTECWTGSTYFVGLIEHVFNLVGQNKKLMLMMNNEVKGVRERETVLTKGGFEGRYELMPVNTHGYHKWQDETEFALLFVHRWNPDCNSVGSAYADSIGVSFSELVNAYENSMMFEPIAQAATRGVIRKDSGISCRIYLLDTRTVNYLQQNVFPKAKIDTNSLLPLQSIDVEDKRIRNGGMKSHAKRRWGLSDTQARFIYRRAEKAGMIDKSNAMHVNWIDALVKDKYPEQALEHEIKEIVLF